MISVLGGGRTHGTILAMTIPTGPGAPEGDTPLDVLAESRERTLALVASISDEDLERVHST